MTVHNLPAVNATLNGLSAVFLTAGFIAIKRGNKFAHRNCMISAVVTSAIFLGCYLTYHATVKTVTHFVEPAWFKPIYLTILLTHTVLAAIIVPLIIITIAFRFEKVVSSRNKLASIIGFLAAAFVLIGLALAFFLGISRTNLSHWNIADEISGALFALSLIMGIVSVLLFLFESHKKIAHWTWPLWVYVSVTGVVIYLLLYQIFPQK